MIEQQTDSLSPEDSLDIETIDRHTEEFLSHASTLEELIDNHQLEQLARQNYKALEQQAVRVDDLSDYFLTQDEFLQRLGVKELDLVPWSNWSTSRA